jgi:hypothetical protein
MDKKKADPKASPNNSQIQNTSLAAQNARLVERLKTGPIDTFTAMSELNICRPGARICDLRDMGYRIHTQRVKLTDAWGYTHQGVAIYTLLSEPAQEAA